MRWRWRDERVPADWSMVVYRGRLRRGIPRPRPSRDEAGPPAAWTSRSSAPSAIESECDRLGLDSAEDVSPLPIEVGRAGRLTAKIALPLDTAIGPGRGLSRAARSSGELPGGALLRADPHGNELSQPAFAGPLKSSSATPGASITAAPSSPSPGVRSGCSPWIGRSNPLTVSRPFESRSSIVRTLMSEPLTDEDSPASCPEKNETSPLARVILIR